MKYFISFVSIGENIQHVGNVIINVDRTFTNMNDIETVQELIKDTYTNPKLDNVVILNYREM